MSINYICICIKVIKISWWLTYQLNPCTTQAQAQAQAQRFKFQKEALTVILSNVVSDQPTRSTYKYPQPIPMLFTHSRRIHPSIPKTSCFVSFVLFLSTMDFHTLSRKQLQTLCKKNKIPANIANVAMADALAALNKVNLSFFDSFLLFSLVQTLIYCHLL